MCIVLYYVIFIVIIIVLIISCVLLLLLLLSLLLLFLLCRGVPVGVGVQIVSRSPDVFHRIWSVYFLDVGFSLPDIC